VAPLATRVTNDDLLAGLRSRTSVPALERLLELVGARERATRLGTDAVPE
jgi:hypothetical protein